MSTSLLRDWGLLQDHVVPPLLAVNDRPVRAWSIGDSADAVAVAVAYAAAAGGSCERITAFATDDGPDRGPVSFGFGDVGSLPQGSRSAWFERDRRRWIPKNAIAEQVVLGPPSLPVDLVTVRSAGGAATAAAWDRLRWGGHLLVVDPASDRPGPAGLRPLDAAGRLFCKVAQEAGPAAPPSGIEGTGQPGPTLAAHEHQQELVLAHLDLAKSLARRFAHRGQSLEELEQVAVAALVGAARRFNPEMGKPFAAYATANVVGELKRYFRDKTWALRVPRSLQELHLAVKEAREELGQQLAGSPTVAQVAARLEVTEEQVLEAMEAGSTYRADALELGTSDDEHQRDIPVVDPAFERTLDRHRLQAALPRLDERDRLIVKALFFDGRTQQDVAGELGVSQMQVSRLLARILAKLRR